MMIYFKNDACRRMKKRVDSSANLANVRKCGILEDRFVVEYQVKKVTVQY